MQGTCPALKLLIKQTSADQGLLAAVGSSDRDSKSLIGATSLDRQGAYRAYPLQDHIADKTCAILEVYGQARPSTRFKDLVEHAYVSADDQFGAVASEARRRRLALPASFDVPDLPLWERGNAAEARRAFLPTARTLPEALAQVRPYLDPLLDRSAAGSWDPAARRWGS